MNTRREESVLKAFRAVERFNACASKQTETKDTSVVLNKMKRVIEEMLETLQAIEDNDEKEILDGVVDVLYTALGVIKAAEDVGMDVFGALDVVVENNDTKLMDTIEHANETAVMYEEQNIPVDILYNTLHNKFVVVNKTEGKVLKPKGYKRVELSSFVKGE